MTPETPKIFIFLKTPKHIEIQILNPPKMGQAYVYVEISEYPPPHTHTHSNTAEAKIRVIQFASKPAYNVANISSVKIH